MANERMKFMVEDAKLMFRNFSGVEDDYNTKGDRNFAVVLSEEQAAEMDKEGWLIKRTKPREGDEEDMTEPFISVTAGYKHTPPSVMLVTSNSRVPLDESTVGTLDHADLKTVDLICTAYHWEVGGKTGIKAYLQTMFAVLDENPLELKWGSAALVIQDVDE